MRWAAFVAVAFVASACASAHGGARPAPAVATTRDVNGTILDADTGRPVAHVSADGLISGAAPDGHGGWFIAGGFTRVDGARRPHLAHIRGDGSLDRGWRPPALAPENRVGFFLGVARAGLRVVVAGGFRSAGGMRVPGLVALDARSGAVDRAWHPPALCAEGYWRARASGGHVVAATACGAGRCVAALHPEDGHSLPGFSARIAATGEVGCVSDLAISGAAVFLTGGFAAVGGIARDGVAAVRLEDGRPIPGFAPRGACAGIEHAIAVAPPLVFVGGDGCPVAAFGISSGARRWAWRRRGNATSAALLVHGRRLYVGGELVRLAGARVNGLAVLSPRTGAPVASWHPARPAVVQVLSLSGERILVGAD